MIDVECPNPEMRSLIHRAYGAFSSVSSDGGGNSEWKAVIRVVGSLPPHIERNLEVDKTPIPVYSNGNVLEIDGKWFNGCIDIAKKVAELSCPVAVHPFDSLIRIVYINSGASNSSLLVHASAVLIDDKVWVFFGPSGAGKSTVAQAAGSDSLLSDELVGLRMEGDLSLADGTPFWQGQPISAALGGLVAVEMADNVHATLLEKAEGMRFLWKQVQIVGLDAGGVQSVWQTVADIVEKTNVFRLGIARQPGLWSDIKKTLVA